MKELRNKIEKSYFVKIRNKLEQVDALEEKRHELAIDAMNRSGLAGVIKADAIDRDTLYRTLRGHRDSINCKELYSQFEETNCEYWTIHFQVVDLKEQLSNVIEKESDLNIIQKGARKRTINGRDVVNAILNNLHRKAFAVDLNGGEYVPYNYVHKWGLPATTHLYVEIGNKYVYYEFKRVEMAKDNQVIEIS